MDLEIDKTLKVKYIRVVIVCVGETTGGPRGVDVETGVSVGGYRPASVCGATDAFQ